MGGDGSSSDSGASARVGSKGSGTWKLTHPKWTGVSLTAQKALTGSTQKLLSEDEHLKALLGLKPGNKKPILLYFHYEHETEADAATAEGQISAAACKLIKAESAARWEMLFTCYLVNASKSDEKLMRRLGLGEGTSFAVLDETLQVISKAEEFKSDAQFASHWKKILPAKLPAYWKSVEESIADQEAKMEQAKKLEKKDKLAEAAALYREIYQSDVRIAPWWQSAFEQMSRIEDILKPEEPARK